jgi:membrane protein required for colicin V production
MNYIDIVLILILIFAAFNGFRQGLIIELASLAALILGIWGAVKFSDWTASFIKQNMGFHSEYTGIIAFFLTFIVIVFCIHILGKVIDNMVKAIALGFLNRLAGIIFGVLKVSVILSILLLLFDPIDENVHILPANQKSNSKMYVPMRQLVPTLFPFIDLWKTSIEKSTDQKATDAIIQPKST